MIDKDQRIEELEAQIESLSDTILELNERAYISDSEYEESIKLYQTTLDISMEMIVLLDKKFTIIDVNKSTLNQLGYKNKQELLGQTISTMMDEYNYNLFNSTLHSNSLKPLEMKIYDVDKNLFPILLQSIKIEKMEDIEYIVTLMDLREIKRKETILQQQSLSATMGFMMDEIAHQWKQPLGVISVVSSNIDMKLDMGLEVLQKDLKDCTNTIETQTNHLIETIDEFRQFFRNNNKKELNNISKMLQFVTNLLKSTLVKNNITINIQCDSSFTLDIVSIEFKHIIINLINNSIDAFRENNISNKVINIKVTKENNDTIISFVDNAGGINEKIIKNIFDFNITTKKKGTGVGLYLVKQIIEKSNALIDVSNYKDGVKFSMKFNKEIKI